MLRADRSHVISATFTLLSLTCDWILKNCSPPKLGIIYMVRALRKKKERIYSKEVKDRSGGKWLYFHSVALLWYRKHASINYTTNISSEMEKY